MTAEIALMNKMAVALAADSAVTVKHGKKIYNSANKLFMLSKYHPVGIMIYGNAELMEVPWEILIKQFRKKLGTKKYDRLEDYAQNFIDFLNNNDFIDNNCQERYFYYSVASYLDMIVDKIEKVLDEKYKEEPKIIDKEITKVVSNVVAEEYEKLNNLKNLPIYHEGFQEEILKSNLKLIDKAIDKVFKDYNVTKETRELLMSISTLICFKGKFSSERSGIVIAGYGEKEILPALNHYIIDGVYLNKLKYSEPDCSRITFQETATIQAFAQSDMVTTFIEGMDPSLQEFIDSYLESIFSDYPSYIYESLKNKDNINKEEFVRKVQNMGNHLLRDFRSKIYNFSRERIVNPIIKNIAILPKDELAAAAEALVNLTSFKRKVSMDIETVGGPIDVAIISKSDGFIWMKRKHYFKPELNNHFFANYYNEY